MVEMFNENEQTKKNISLSKLFLSYDNTDTLTDIILSKYFNFLAQHPRIIICIGFYYKIKIDETRVKINSWIVITSF